MKRYLQIYIFLGITSILHAQNNSNFYGLERGTFSAGNFLVTQQYGTLNNTVIIANKYSGLQSFPLNFDYLPYFKDTTLNYYEIGKIPEQRVAAGFEIHFYVKCDELSGSKSYSILPLNSSNGNIVFKDKSQYFSFTPDSLDTAVHRIRFIAMNLEDTISQLVVFKVYQLARPEIYSFGVGNAQPLPDPNADEYQLLSVINNYKQTWFNNQNRKTRNISLSGVDLSVENVPGNLLFAMSGSKDITQLNIFADRLFIKDTLNLPQTEVNIYCRQLIFEDIKNHSGINTTPIKSDAALPNANGNDGQTAGRINIFAGQIIDNEGGIRFRLIGGDGQSATNATAGSGGNGGILFSNQDIAYKGDYIGGLAGKYAGSSGSPAFKNKGNSGKFAKDSINLRWIHPNYIRQYISYSKDAYFAGYGNSIMPSILFYSGLITSLTNSNDIEGIDSYTISDILQTQLELVSLTDRIISGNDYFGNPPGWVPLLSFEFTKAAFDAELQHAMQILYLDYFITTASDTLQKRLNGFTALRDELKQNSIIDKNNFNNLVLVTVPEIENNIDLNNQRINHISQDITSVMAQIQTRADKAVNDLKKPSWQKIAGCIGTVATMVPYPPVQTGGAAVLSGLQFYEATKNIDNLNIESAISIVNSAKSSIDTYKKYESQFENTVEKWKKIGDQWQSFFPVFQGGLEINAIKTQVEKGKNLANTLSAVYSDLTAAYNKYFNVSDPVLQKIRSDLLANDPTLASLNTELRETSEKHKQLIEEYSSTNNQILSLGSQIMAYGLAFDDANSKVLSNTKILDHRTVHYIHYLRDNALLRLKKYYYYMSKAYEARTLLPFSGYLNLGPILSSIEKMAISANNSVLTPEQYTSFSALYKQQIEVIAQDIYDYYVSNAPAQTISTTYSLSSDDIKNLNLGETVIFNPSKRGLFGNNEENIRINSIKVLSLFDSIGRGTTIGNPAHIDVKFEYPLISHVRRNGKVYYFNNYNRNTNTPLTWSSRYDYATNQIRDFKPSSANASLLISLCTDKGLPHLNDDILMYSRPSADADLILSSSFLNNNGDGNLFIDSLIILLEYDFNSKPPNISYLDILSEPNWIVPYYTVSKSDQNGMNNGQGDMTRAYTTSSSNLINLSVEKKIGGYRFERWLNQAGYPVLDKDSLNPSRSFIMKENQVMKAKYKWAGAKLSLPDTLYFSSNTLTETLVIRNIGETDTMYWVRDAISPFVTIGNNVSKGFGNETISITMTNHNHDTIGFIAITAPDAENAIDTVWLKYNIITKIDPIDELEKIILYPNPSKDKVYLILPDQMNKNYQISLMDATGKKINFNSDKKSDLIVFDSSGLAAGIYFITIVSNNHKKVLKFIKTY